MCRVVVIGGGWSGCAAAIAAKKAGADVVLVEKTDLLLGLGNVGGIMRNNGRFTAAEENIAMGAGELFETADRCARHINIEFPGHKHATLYDVVKTEPAVKRLLLDMGIELRMVARAVDCTYVRVGESGSADRKSGAADHEGTSERRKSAAAGHKCVSEWCDERNDIRNGSATPRGIKHIESITLADGEVIEGDVFVECTGSTGPMGNCLAYGNGCSMCVLRCPAFGPRVSISQKAGCDDLMGTRVDGSFGAFSGSGKLVKESLAPEIQQELNEKGVAIIPLPPDQIKKEKLNIKVCQQYALDEFAENIILLDTGYAKIMTPFFPLEKLRQVKGFEDARYADPYAGGKGNSIRYLSTAQRDNTMLIDTVDNLFCGGEKAGLFVGHTEAICTGTLAGHNAVRYAAGMSKLIIPRILSIGDIIAFGREMAASKDGLVTRYTFAGSTYFERMKEHGLYSTDPDEIAERVERAGLTGVYDTKLI